MNKFKVSLLFLICIFIYSTDVWSQKYPEPPITYWNNKTDKHFIPASPTATELGKYGGVPVSYYTGMPQINIELYTINTSNFNLPIELMYHASGIRVDDLSSWVGLGWSLNAGGVITAAVTGSSDIKKDYPGEEPCEPRVAPMTFEDVNNYDVSYTSEQLRRLNSQDAEKCLDAEPDLFNYQFGNYSGQFILDHNYEVKFLKNSNGISITFNKDTKSFMAIDNYGNIFDFSVIEYTNQRYRINGLSGSKILYHYSLGSTEVPTSYYLKNINIAGSDEEILFEYDAEAIRYYTRNVGLIHTKYT